MPTLTRTLLRKLALDDNYITGDGLAGFAAAMMAPSLPDEVWALSNPNPNPNPLARTLSPNPNPNPHPHPNQVWALPSLEHLEVDGNEFGHTCLAELAAVLRSGAMPALN